MRAELTAKAIAAVAALRERLRLVRRDIGLRWERLGRSMREARAELLTMTATLGGWALVTWGIASLTSAQAWKFSAGILLLSSCGWQFLSHVAWRGLYQLTRRTPNG